MRDEAYGKSHAFTIRVVEGLELNDIGMADDTHDLKFTVLEKNMSVVDDKARNNSQVTLNLLSWRTRLIAASSPDGDSLVWKTTPKDPFPTILHCVYCRSRVSPVMPSWTFSRTTSNEMLVHMVTRK